MIKTVCKKVKILFLQIESDYLVLAPIYILDWGIAKIFMTFKGYIKMFDLLLTATFRGRLEGVRTQMLSKSITSRLSTLKRR